MSEKAIDLKIISTQRIVERPVDPSREKRMADAESGRQQALVYAQEALLAAVSTMRTTKDDGKRLQACKMILDRAWGVPKTADDASETQKNQSIIELLASMSSNYTSLPSQAASSSPQLTQSDPGALEGLFVEVPDA